MSKVDGQKRKAALNPYLTLGLAAAILIGVIAAIAIGISAALDDDDSNYVAPTTTVVAGGALATASTATTEKYGLVSTSMTQAFESRAVCNEKRQSVADAMAAELGVGVTATANGPCVKTAEGQYTFPVMYTIDKESANADLIAAFNTDGTDAIQERIKSAARDSNNPVLEGINLDSISVLSKKNVAAEDLEDELKTTLTLTETAPTTNQGTDASSGAVTTGATKPVDTEGTTTEMSSTNNPDASSASTSGAADQKTTGAASTAKAVPTATTQGTTESDGTTTKSDGTTTKAGETTGATTATAASTTTVVPTTTDTTAPQESSVASTDPASSSGAPPTNPP
ncbi:hypothetical protein SNEBB_007837 [Seison nebaliae]|nr:hypothetical protein SNEBB_007837 [Seison nebaliae]